MKTFTLILIALLSCSFSYAEPLAEHSVLLNEQINQSIEECNFINGTAVYIRGGLYCKIGEEYRTLVGSKEKEVSPKNIVILFIVLLIAYIIIKDIRELQIEKKIRGSSFGEEPKSLKRQNNRRHSDGGLY